MCVCVSTIAGMTVLPARVDARGAGRNVQLAASADLGERDRPSTMKAAFSMGALPSPTMSARALEDGDACRCRSLGGGRCRRDGEQAHQQQTGGEDHLA